MEVPLNELLQWGGGLLGVGVSYGVLRQRVNNLEERMRRGSDKLDDHSNTDAEILAAMARVEAKVDDLKDRVKRVEDKVLNGG